MRHQALRPTALMLSYLLVASATTAQADTLRFTEVVRTGTTNRGAAPDLRLRSLQQGGKATAAGVAATAQGRADGNASSAGQTNSPDGSAGATTSLVGSDNAVSGGASVEMIDLGEITGTVCDCGEMQVELAGPAGFPMWPLIGLAGIPVFFIDDDNEEPPTNPSPTPNAPIPEPATLLLFGSGLLALGAGARRRRSLKTTAVQAGDAEVV